MSTPAAFTSTKWAAPTSVWPDRLLRTGREQLHRLGGAVDAADPRSTVSLRSRLLCAGLAELARVTHAAVGGDPGLRICMPLACSEVPAVRHPVRYHILPGAVTHIDLRKYLVIRSCGIQKPG